MLKIAQTHEAQAHCAEQKTIFIDRDQTAEMFHAAQDLSATLGMLRGLAQGGILDIRCFDPKESGGFGTLFKLMQEMAEHIAKCCHDGMCVGIHLTPAQFDEIFYTWGCVYEMHQSLSRMTSEGCLESPYHSGFGHLEAVLENGAERVKGVSDLLFEIKYGKE